MKIQLEKVLEYEQPQKYIVATENYSDEYTTPVLTAGKSFILGYTDETDGIYKGTESPVIIFDDFTSDTKYVDFDFKVKSSAMKILHKVNKEDFLKYFFYAMQKIQYKPFSHKRLWISEYSKFEIEKRTPEEQKIVVNDLDNINNAISLAKQRLLALNELVKSRFIEMFGDCTNNTNNWALVKLNDICDVRDGTHDSPEYFSVGVPLITSKNISSGYLDFSNVSLISEKDAEQINKRSKVDKGDILLPMIGTVGGAVIIDIEPNFCIKNVALIKFTKSNISNIFVREYLNSDAVNAIFESVKNGGTQKFVGLGTIRNLPISIPPISLQNEFAEFVKLIDKSKFVCQFIQGTFYAKFARFRPPP